MEQKIFYKVVNQHRRSIYSYGKYCLEYFKDTIVEAAPFTLGIFVFDREYEAISFANQERDEKFSVIEVENLGEVIQIEVVSFVYAPKFFEEYLDSFYRSRHLATRQFPRSRNNHLTKELGLTRVKVLT